MLSLSPHLLSCCLSLFCQSPRYPTNWLRGTLFASLCPASCGFRVGQYSPFSMPLCRNSGHSSRPSSGHSSPPPIHEAFSDYCILVKTFLLQGVHSSDSLPHTTYHLNLTFWYLLEFHVCPNGFIVLLHVETVSHIHRLCSEKILNESLQTDSEEVVCYYRDRGSASQKCVPLTLSRHPGPNSARGHLIWFTAA